MSVTLESAAPARTAHRTAHETRADGNTPAALNPLVSALYGCMLGAIPFALSMMLPTTFRSPYLLAYPAVILSGWLWGLPASVACASVAALLIEQFIFRTHQLVLSPEPGHWVYRESMFVAGSVLVGVLTRSAALKQGRAATAVLHQKLALAQAERAIANERERNTELALENQVRTQLALDGANAGVWEWNIRTNASTWSSGFFRLHGIEPGTPTNYDIWANCIHPDDRNRTEAELWAAVAESGRFSTEYRVVLPGGEVRWIACDGFCLCEPDGQPFAMTGFSGDVTRRKLADLALIHSEKLAVAGRLSAAIAHEINNPLEASLNLVYLALAGNIDPEGKRFLEDAMEQLQRVSRIAHQTLRFSRNSDHRSACRMSEILTSTLQLLAPRLKMAQVELSTEIRNDPEFLCAPGEVQQLLTNVLTNAIEAMPGPGRIRIRTRESASWTNPSQRGVRITVGDTGAGMPPDVRRRMLDAFFTTKQANGTGLGMWIVNELLRKHGGALAVSSSTRPGHRGTVLSLFLPLTPGTASGT